LYGRDHSSHGLFGSVFAHNKRAEFSEIVLEIYPILQIRRENISIGHANSPNQFEHKSRQTFLYYFLLTKKLH